MSLPFPRPASLNASWTISRPTEANIDTMAKVYFDSFATDPANTYWWSEDIGAMEEWLRMRIRKKLADPTVRHFLILDEQKELVAFVRWDIPKGYESRFGEWVGIDGAAVDAPPRENGAEEQPATTTAPVEEAAPAAAKTIAIPRGADPELCQSFFSLLAELSKKWDAEKMLGLSLLCTAPKYHRRGAGKALLTPMLAIADAAGLRSYVEATNAGRPLYEKLGFRVVETREIDAAAATGGRVDAVGTLSIMIREPQPL